jgi:carbonic anhydrase
MASALNGGIAPHLQVGGQLLLKNTGVSFQVHETTPELRVLPLGGGLPIAADPPSTKGYTMLLGQRFNWLQVHYHTPSENTIDGQHAALEAHYVHELADEEYRGEGGLAGIAKQLAVVAVLYDVSNDNTCNEELSAFWDGFPAAVAGEANVGIRPGYAASSAPVDFGASLSRALAGGYYSWTGSLTTPPCTEGVHWALLKTRWTVCAAQLDRLRRALAASQHGVSVNNRVTQPLNLRVITSTSAGGVWGGGAAGALGVLAVICCFVAPCVLVALGMLLRRRHTHRRGCQRGTWASQRCMLSASTDAICSGPSFHGEVSFGSSSQSSTAEGAEVLSVVCDSTDGAISPPRAAQSRLGCTEEKPEGGTEMQGGGLRSHRAPASRSSSFQGPPSISCSPAHCIQGVARATRAAASGITFLGHTSADGGGLLAGQEGGGYLPTPSLTPSIATTPSGSFDDEGVIVCRRLVPPSRT